MCRAGRERPETQSDITPKPKHFKLDTVTFGPAALTPGRMHRTDSLDWVPLEGYCLGVSLHTSLKCHRKTTDYKISTHPVPSVLCRIVWVF